MIRADDEMNTDKRETAVQTFILKTPSNFMIQIAWSFILV
jgi:hypothetical protein